MKLFSFKTRLYIEEFLGDCMPIYPLYALMFSERSGLSTGEISLLFVWWTVVALLAEVPTGIIADRFSRKKALIYCLVLQAAAFATWLIMPNFIGYAVGFLLWGIGYAFSSGTFQAYLYEELREQGKKSEFNKIFARSQSMQLLGMMVAYVIASVIGASNYSLALVLSIAFSLTAAAITVSFPYASRRKPGEYAPERYVHALVNATKEVKRSRVVLAYVLALAVITGLVGTIEEYVALFYSHVGFPTASIPIILAVGLLISTVLGWFAHRFENLSFVKVSLMTVAGGCLLFVTMFGGMWAAMFGMMALMRLLILSDTLFNSSLQHVIEDERRATVGSLASFGGSLVAIVFMGIIGILSVWLGDTTMYRITALIVVAFGAGLVILGQWSKAKITPPQNAGEVVVPGRPV